VSPLICGALQALKQYEVCLELPDEVDTVARKSGFLLLVFAVFALLSPAIPPG
jgi:hypothetical protein